MPINDAKGILKNTARIMPLFPGMRPAALIKEGNMTSSLLNFDHSISIGESISADISFLSPKYYANSLWIGKSLDLYEGSAKIASFTVTEITNPVLDVDAEKWICLDGRAIHTMSDFYNLIEEKLTYNINFRIGRNLNAFNDLLWGGFGIHEYEEPLHIVWIFAKESQQALGRELFEAIISVIREHESNNKYLELYDEHAENHLYL